MLSVGGDRLPTAQGTAVPSLACLQQIWMSGATGCSEGWESPGEIGRAWLAWLSKAGSVRGTWSLPPPDPMPSSSANWPQLISKYVLQLRPGKDRIWPFGFFFFFRSSASFLSQRRTQPGEAGPGQAAPCGKRGGFRATRRFICIFRVRHRHEVTKVSEIPPWSGSPSLSLSSGTGWSQQLSRGSSIPAAAVPG